MPITITLVTHDTLHDAADNIGGAALTQWSRNSGFDDASIGAYLLCPMASDTGELAHVLVLVSEPCDLWSCASLASTLPAGEYAFDLSYITNDDKPALHAQLALGWMLEQYYYERYKKPSDTTRRPELVYDDSDAVIPMRDAVFMVRDLVNTPPSDMGPKELADAAIALAATYNADCGVTQGETLERNFPAIHAVGKGSPRAPRLIDLNWGDASHPKITLVGKGVCFDAGGLNMKSSGGMKLMKKDMGGAAFSLGLASLIMAHKLPVRLRVLIPAVENSVDGASFRPSDVLTMRSGLTVEIGNTDAEGRLVLADALHLACEDKPELLIDSATLTGAARVALGTEMPAMFSDDVAFASGVMNHAKRSSDYLWQLPLHKPYMSMLDSEIADTNNISTGGYGGAITAALFLQKFVTDNTSWMHIDMMAWNVKKQPGRPSGGEAQGLRAVFGYLSERYGVSDGS